MHLVEHSEETLSSGRREGWTTGRSLWVSLVILMVVWGLWSLRPSATSEPPPFAGSAERRATSEDRDPESREATTRSRPRPFRRSEAGLPALDGRSWKARLRTNGVLDVDRLKQDAAYERKVIQSGQLKLLIHSPASETPECSQIVAFVDRKGLPLAATVDLYNIVWATRDYETRVAAAAAPSDKEPLEMVRGLELSDFEMRFQRDYGVDVGPMLEELFTLPIYPKVFMGIPDRAFSPGEALLSD